MRARVIHEPTTVQSQLSVIERVQMEADVLAVSGTAVMLLKQYQ